MAIRFGMTLAEIIGQLTRGFMKATGRKPEALEKIKIQQEAVQRFKDMNKVVDMEGSPIDTSKGIMGGKQIQESPEFGKKIKETYDKAKGPGKGQEMVDALKSPGAKKSYKIIEDQLGVKLYGDETFEEILQIQKTGKHPRGEPKADGGRIGYKDGMLKRGLKAITGTDTYKTLEDRGFNAAVLMSEGFDQIYNLLSGMPGLAEGGRAGFSGGGMYQMDLPFGKPLFTMVMNKKLYGIYQNKDGSRLSVPLGPDGKPSYAEGGRIGYKDGPEKPGRRKFIKTAVGLATLIPGLGKGIKIAKPAVEKAVELSGPALAKLVETVMSFGKTLSMKGRKLKELTTKKKYKDIEVEEDMLDGPSYTIKKGNKEIYYKPGRMDETGGVEDDIIEIIEDTVTKKAGGGIARMLGE